MKERASLSGGVMDIKSEIGKGTKIKVLWPVAEQNPGKGINEPTTEK
jgi:hypothetical protein